MEGPEMRDQNRKPNPRTDYRAACGIRVRELLKLKINLENDRSFNFLTFMFLNTFNFYCTLGLPHALFYIAILIISCMFIHFSLCLFIMSS